MVRAQPPPLPAYQPDPLIVPDSLGLPDSSGVPGSLELPDFAEAVLDLVDQIPAGRVLAYGDVAELLGRGGPRQVGSVMSRYGSAVTWWRVTRANGEPPQGLEDGALAHWRGEGTPLVRGSLAGRRVDMSRARWDGRPGRRNVTSASM